MEPAIPRGRTRPWTPSNRRASTNLRDLVLRRVRADIVSGACGPERCILSLRWPRRLGVSTTPVREALLELSHSGLITPVRNRGFRVEATTLETLSNGFALRELLERFAMVSLAEQRLTDTGPLRELADDVAAAVRRKDGRGYIESDRAFHLALVSRLNDPCSPSSSWICATACGSTAWIRGRRQRQIASVKEHYQLIDLASPARRRRSPT